MKLCARSLMLLFSSLALLPSLVCAQCKCTCRPSPPGGTTRCEAGQIAICSDGGDGTCQGSCITVSAEIEPLDLTATLLSRITRKEVSKGQIRENHEAVKTIIDQLMEGSRSDKTFTLDYKDRKFAVSVGMTDRAQNRMAAARAQLNMYNAR